MGRAEELLPGNGPVAAIIGGGASGTLAAVQLLRRAAATGLPLRVLLIDRDGRHGPGRAYATTDPRHLLNSPAIRMSALPGDPGHLVRWAQARGIEHDGFLARRDYGRYLGELLADAQRRAWPAARLHQLTAEVVSASRAGPGLPLRLGLAAGAPAAEADVVVLATGSPPPGAPCPVPAGPRYIADPWAPGALDGAGDGSPVLIAGTGLTMLDVAVTVTDADPRTVVHAVSRHALLPREHRGAPRPGAPAAAVPGLAGGPLRLAGLVRQVRRAAAEHPGDWQDVLDVLRPQVPGLWQRLPAADQRLFLGRYARYWEVHRHRVPPATARRIDALRAAGRLRVLRGAIVAASGGPGGVRARVDHGGGAVTSLDAGWLVNGTGPAADITRAADPLLHDLLRTGLVRPDPLRLGLDADADGAVLDFAGRAGGRIFAIGPPLRGTRYETTAIAEIACQAESLARHLITVSRVLARPGSAA